MPVLIYSSECPAGRNIANALLPRLKPAPKSACGAHELPTWMDGRGITLIEFNKRLSSEAEELSALSLPQDELVVFLSRHASKEKRPCFTVHAAGNWTQEPNWGGRPGELAKTSATALAAAIQSLQNNCLQGFTVDLEATHHGPTNLSWSSLFVEVGSSETEWQNQTVCAVVAQACLAACNPIYATEKQVAIGIGGTHYCPKFGKLEGKEYLFSHVCPKHSADYLNAGLLRQAIEKTVEKVDCVVIDWKGLSSQQKLKTKEICESLSIPTERA